MANSAPTSIKQRAFGKLASGKEATLYTLSNSNGVQVDVCDYGATLVALRCPDREGNIGNIVLGFHSIEAYLESDAYLGATVGRFANRIADGKFELKEKQYSLDINGTPNHIHGGVDGFDKRMWHANVLSQEASAIRFSLFSPDGDQGYPGNLSMHCVYRLENDNRLTIAFDATCDQSTPISITNHSYFNLAGSASVLDHWLTLDADFYTPMNQQQIPTGEIAPVADTPFDFRSAHQIGERINDNHEQLKITSGYDQNFITKAQQHGGVVHAAKLRDEPSGRQLDIFTDAPAMQVYTANFLEGAPQLNLVRHSSICIEPQNFPDAPNNNAFPSCILHPGETYKNTIVFAISAD